MARQSIPISLNLLPMVAAFLLASVASADPPKKDDPEKEADAEYRREAAKLVGGIEVEVLVAEKWSKVKRIEKPLLYYGDATRENDRGSVWG